MTSGSILQGMPVVHDPHAIVSERQELTNLSTIGWLRLIETSEESLIVDGDAERDESRVIDASRLIRDQTNGSDRGILLLGLDFHFPFEHVDFTAALAHDFDGEFCAVINHFGIGRFHGEADTFRSDIGRQTSFIQDHELRAMNLERSR